MRQLSRRIVFGVPGLAALIVLTASGNSEAEVASEYDLRHWAVGECWSPECLPDADVCCAELDPIIVE